MNFRSPVPALARPLLRSTLVVALSMLVFSLSAGCGSGVANDPILRLSAQEALEEGKKLLEAKKYRQARKYLIHAFEVEPNSASGREGLIKAADAMFLQGGYDSYVEAETRYRDFLNRFPTSELADYAQFRIAMCLAKRMEKPNRDQETTHKAQIAFENLIRAFPTSPYVEQAREEIKRVRDQLAEHEFVVGYYYFRTSGGSRRTRGLAAAAVSRFEKLLEDHPEYSDRERVLLYLCLAHDRLDQVEKAAEVCGRFREEFPNSEHSKKIPQLATSQEA